MFGSDWKNSAGVYHPVGCTILLAKQASGYLPRNWSNEVENHRPTGVLDPPRKQQPILGIR